MNSFYRNLLFVCLLLLFVSFTRNVQGQAANAVKYPPLSETNFSLPSIQKGDGRTMVSSRTADFSYPTGECFAYTYKIQVGNSSSQSVVKDVFTAANGYTYVVGQIDGAGGRKYALFQRINYNGDIAYTKAISLTSNPVVKDSDETINSIKELPNGKLVFIGTSQDPTNGLKHLFIGQADSSGTVDWINRQNTPGYEGIAVSPTPASGIGFVGQNGPAILYGRLDYNGALQWYKTVTPMATGKVVGMVNDGSVEWYIAYTGIDSARKVGALLQIDPANGQISWMDRFGGPANNADFIFQCVEIVNLRPRISGVYSVGGNAYRLFKLTVNVAGTAEQLLAFNTPGITVDTTARTALNSNAEVFTFQARANDSSLYLFKTINETYPDTLIAWWKKFDLGNGHEIATVEGTFDGGFMAVTNLKNPENPVFLKTDSIGFLKQCESSLFNVSADKQIFIPYYKTAAASAYQSVAYSPVSSGLTVVAMPVSVFCKEMSCPPVAFADACLQTFIRRYRGVTVCDAGTDLFLTPQSELYIAGGMRDDPYQTASSWATLVKLRANGQVLDRRKIRFGNASGFDHLLTLRDDNFLVLGRSNYKPIGAAYDTGYVTVSKFTKAFQLIWNKSFPVYGPYSAVYGVVEAADGSLFLHYIEGKNFCESIRILKLDAQGNLQWIKKYNTANTCLLGYQGSVTQDDDYLYAGCFASSTAGALLMKISKADGSLLWTKAYTIAGGTQSLLCNDITFVGDKLAVVGAVNGNGWSKGALMLMDKGGTVIKAKAFYNNNSAINLKMIVAANRDIVLVSPGYTEEAFIRMDSLLNIRYAKKIQSKGAASKAIREGPDGGIYGIGPFANIALYNTEPALKKQSFDGLVGSCAVDTFNYNITDQPILVTSMTTSVASFAITLESLPLQERPYSLQQNDLLCASVGNCNVLKLSGNMQVCDTASQTYTVARNSGCTVPVQFFYSDPSIKLVNKTDSSVTVQFAASGNVSLKAKLFTGCSWLMDSLEIATSIINQPFDIGPDRSLCPGNSIVLNAHKGYASYLWQDGSSDSTFTVTQPGLYYVTTTDACGGIFKDSVTVTAAPTIPFDAGTDRTKCNGDSLHLSAPSGFINYTWGNNYNISSTTSQNVVVNPLVDTAYYIKAEKTPGCFAYDTVRITVYHSPLINLGIDRSFCMGDSTIFDAGSGFQNYTWSGGQTAQQITVKTAGTYFVTGTTAQGCKSYDTIKVLNVYSLPVVKLDKASALCSGASKTLSAGSFSSYKWNTGGNTATIVVNGIGQYAVTVADTNGCKGSDTTAITTIYPLPAGFLPADTAVCSYGAVTLKPLTAFNRYLWNTGDPTPSLTVSKPGLYWLDAVDANACKGRDTIVVNLKECMKGFYAPGAFTPNRDGKNDVFYPMLFGKAKAYSFSIYNRWGQMVFQTTDLQKGWDGKIAGILQETGVFVWTCTYQFEGEAPKTEKGTVTLIR